MSFDWGNSLTDLNSVQNYLGESGLVSLLTNILIDKTVNHVLCDKPIVFPVDLIIEKNKMWLLNGLMKKLYP